MIVVVFGFAWAGFARVFAHGSTEIAGLPMTGAAFGLGLILRCYGFAAEVWLPAIRLTTFQSPTSRWPRELHRFV